MKYKALPFLKYFLFYCYMAHDYLNLFCVIDIPLSSIKIKRGTQVVSSYTDESQHHYVKCIQMIAWVVVSLPKNIFCCLIVSHNFISTKMLCLVISRWFVDINSSILPCCEVACFTATAKHKRLQFSHHCKEWVAVTGWQRLPQHYQHWQVSMGRHKLVGRK